MGEYSVLFVMTNKRFMKQSHEVYENSINREQDNNFILLLLIQFNFVSIWRAQRCNA